MAACEKCWADAYARCLAQPTKDHHEHYSDLVAERNAFPCTPKEQAGGWWCEAHQMDRRSLHHPAACDEIAGLA